MKVVDWHKPGRTIFADTAWPYRINVIWPFVPNQVEWFGFDVESVGKYVGILAAVFFLCQFLSSFVW